MERVPGREKSLFECLEVESTEELRRVKDI
jgi:hypothetical protein